VSASAASAFLFCDCHARAPSNVLSLTRRTRPARPLALSRLPRCTATRCCREERYLKDPDPFDWYQRYNNNPHLRGLIEKAVPRTAAILVPGSGTSRLSEDMLADGYAGGITNIDISRTAIDLMADRCKDRAGLQCALAADKKRRVAALHPSPCARAHARTPHTLLPAAPAPALPGSARSPGDEQLLPGLPRRLL
jgi:hypothetical protein